MRAAFRFMGWLRLLPGLALLLTMVLSASGQGTFTYQRYYTDSPDPNFPWDYEGRRVMSLFPTSMTIDINQDGTADYLIGTGGAQSTRGFYIYGLQQANRVWSYRTGESRYAIALNAGESISLQTSPVYSWEEPVEISGTIIGSAFTVEVDIFTIGFFTGIPSAYSGLQMQVNGQTHYGWVRVGSPIGLNGGWVYDSVFNTTPGQSLFAGQGAVPEPSISVLLAIGILTLTIQHRRKSL